MEKDNKSGFSDIFRQKVRQARIKEELAIPIYSSHIEPSLFWSGLPEAKCRKIISGLKILERESKMHARLLKKIEDSY